MTMESNEGPQPVTHYTCTGCRFLSTEYWKDYLDNDETDSGTEAKCKLTSMHITNYYSPRNAVPDWCPLREKMNVKE